MIKKSKKKKSFKKFVFGGLFFCLLGGLAYFLIWSPYLWVKEIKIKTDREPMYYSFAEIEEAARKILENRFLYFIPQKNIILASVGKIEKDILERFPEIKLVNISKKAPSILEIEIEERKGIGVWCNYKEEREIRDCFKIDKDGVIYKESPLISGNLVLNIYSAKNSSAKIKDEVVPPEVMNFILTTKKELSEIKTAGKIFPAVVNFEFVSVEELRAKTLQGWWIYFNPTVSVDLQIDTLKAVLDNEIKGDLSSLEYIDLRIEGRVYYK